jgi:uncharacterized protein with HEPN domain
MSTRIPKYPPAQIVYYARKRIGRILRATRDDSFDSYMANEERQDAVERNFIVIGEAIKDLAAAVSLPDLDPTGPWSYPARFRDVLAHRYDEGVSHPAVLDTIRRDLPVLDGALARIEPLVGGPYDPDADDRA